MASAKLPRRASSSASPWALSRRAATPAGACSSSSACAKRRERLELHTLSLKVLRMTKAMQARAIQRSILAVSGEITRDSGFSGSYSSLLASTGRSVCRRAERKAASAARRASCAGVRSAAAAAAMPGGTTAAMMTTKATTSAAMVLRPAFMPVSPVFGVEWFCA